MAIRALALELSPCEGPPPGGPSVFIRTKFSIEKLLIRREAGTGDADQHLEPTAEDDHLRTGEARCAEPANSTDDGAEPGAFPTTKNSAEQCSCARTKSGMNERFFCRARWIRWRPPHQQIRRKERDRV